MEKPDELKIGNMDELLRLSVASEHRALVPVFATRARRTVNVYTRDFDPAVYDTAEFEAALSEFARRNQHTTVRILLQDSRRAVKEGHRIVRLAQQLSSKIQIRLPGEDDRTYEEAFLVIDDIAFIRRPMSSLYTAEANFNGPVEARRLLKYFDEVWERAEVDPQVRRLSL